VPNDFGDAADACVEDFGVFGFCLISGVGLLIALALPKKADQSKEHYDGGSKAFHKRCGCGINEKTGRKGKERC
jgi:hypothetical protein